MSILLPHLTDFNSSDEDDDPSDDIDLELDKLLLSQETVSDVSSRDLLFLKLHDFFNTYHNEHMAVCCQTLGIANTVAMHYRFEKNGDVNFSQEFKYLKEAIACPTITTYFESELRNIRATLTNLPDEWTIIQLSREINPLSYLNTHANIMSNNSPIYLSLLKYSHWEYNDCNPICIKIAPVKKFCIYDDVQDFITEYGKLFNGTDIGKSEEEKKISYRDLIASVQGKLMKLIENMKDQIGPLAYLLQGKAKESVEDDKLFSNLITFFGKNLTRRQLILVYLFARGADELTFPGTDFLEFVQPLTPQLSSKLIDYLTYYKRDRLVKLTEDHYPCVLIIDELLDSLPWEMIRPTQQFTRIFSLNMLKELHGKYKNQIKNGYLMKKISIGNFLINPDGDLEKMEVRMLAFLKYFRPNWKALVRHVPNSEQCKDLLNNCDLYLYSGHGSGLKYLRGRILMNFELDCVVFIFGCSSVALNSTGLNNSAIGAHVFYHLAQCPTVVGNLYTVTDFDMDSTTAVLLTRFLSDENDSGNDFMSVNRKGWQVGKIEFDREEKVKVEHNLAKLLADIRCDAGILLKMKSAIVLRGLPVYNNL